MRTGQTIGILATDAEGVMLRRRLREANRTVERFAEAVKLFENGRQELEARIEELERLAAPETS